MKAGTQPVILLSSHDFNALNNVSNCPTFPCLMSSIVTEPRSTPLMWKKSNRLRRPSPSFGPKGKIGTHLIDSAILMKHRLVSLWKLVI